jgi:hypothetical protein
MALSFLFASPLLFSQDLKNHRWEDRVILIFGDSPTHPIAQTQVKALNAKPAELIDRNLLIYQIYQQEGQTPKGKRLAPNELKAFRKKFNIEAGVFAVLLIGKDGGVKMKKTTALDPQLIFDLIDSMPMRQSEMRRKG